MLKSVYISFEFIENIEYFKKCGLEKLGRCLMPLEMVEEATEDGEFKSIKSVKMLGFEHGSVLPAKK